MFGIGSSEILVILVLALVLLGPQKLPDLLRAVAKGYAEFRRMTSDVRSTLEREIEKVDEAKRIEETKKELFGDNAETPAAAAVGTVSDQASESPAVAETPSTASDAAPAAAPASGETTSAHASSGEACPAEAKENQAASVQEKAHA